MVNLSPYDDKLQTLSTLGSWHIILPVAKSINYNSILQRGISTNDFFLSVAAKYKETAIPRTLPSKCIFMQTVIFEKIHYLKKRKTSCSLLRSDVLML